MVPLLLGGKPQRNLIRHWWHWGSFSISTLAAGTAVVMPQTRLGGDCHSLGRCTMEMLGLFGTGLPDWGQCRLWICPTAHLTAARRVAMAIKE